jgi:hypothetical protein
MKPVSKAESRWLYWRSENPRERRDGFTVWAKKMMAKARRRQGKLEEKGV